MNERIDLTENRDFIKRDRRWKLSKAHLKLLGYTEHFSDSINIKNCITVGILEDNGAIMQGNASERFEKKFSENTIQDICIRCGKELFPYEKGSELCPQCIKIMESKKGENLWNY